MIKTFAELQVGSRFLVDNIEYIKIDTVRISCCQSINAQEVNNPGSKKFFNDESAVSVNA
jgi:hypothetical protein